MNTKELFSKALEEATSCVQQVKSEQLGNVTPCTEWNLRELLNHTVYELLWIPDVLAGKTIQEIGDKYAGDVLGEDFKSAWQHAAEAAEKAVEAVDLNQAVHLSYGDKTAKEYIEEVGSDILIHGWDVGQSLYSTLLIDKALAEAVYACYLPRKDELVGSGLFAPPLEVPEDADLQVKLLALLGRDAEWYKSKLKMI